MKPKNVKYNIKIKNIEELKTLMKQMKSTLDKIQNFKFDIKVSQCEHSQDRQS